MPSGVKARFQSRTHFGPKPSMVFSEGVRASNGPVAGSKPNAAALSPMAL
jgi:hypothetical protein